MDTKPSSKKVQLNKAMEMIDYYKYYGKEASREIKDHDLEFLSEQLVLLSSLFKEVNNYEFTTQKDAFETFKKIQEKIRKNVDFTIPIY